MAFPEFYQYTAVSKPSTLRATYYPFGPQLCNIDQIILIYIQQDATLHNLFYLGTAVYVLGGTTTHHQERKQLYLQLLVFVAPLLLPAASGS